MQPYRQRWRTLFLTAVVALPAHAQWMVESPTPTYLDVRGVAAPTPSRVFVATSDDSFDAGGALFESADGGATWTQRDVPFSLSSPLNGLFFFDDLRGWAHGNRNYRTVDGGTTWEELQFLGSTYYMEFFTPMFGYASTNGADWLSADGGVTWLVSGDELSAFSFDPADDAIGLGAGGLGIYRTTDGGASFSSALAGVATDIQFLTSALAIGIIDDMFVRSIDGGLTWSSVASASGRSKLTVVSSDVVVASGVGPFFPNDDGQLLRTADAGLTWTDLGTVFPEGTGSFVVPASPVVVATDVAGSMFRSEDAGLTWAQTYTSPGIRPGFLSSARPDFADATTGYFGYGAGFVIKTTDGGASWAQTSSGYGESFADIDQFADGSLIAVGERGTLLFSDGSGAWALQAPLTTDDLVAVDVVGAQSVVVADESGLVYRSSDHGATWTAGTSTPAGLEARDIDFSTPLDGWITGSGFGSAAVFHTTDGGDTWSGVPGFLGIYTAIDFESTSGWALNVGGVFYRTTDAGVTWTQGNLPGANSVNDIEFYDEFRGYAAGRYGYAVRTDDGGMTWTELTTPDEDDHVTDIHVVGPNELWLSTADGIVYYSATGGQSWATLDVGIPGISSFSAVIGTPSGDAWTRRFPRLNRQIRRPAASAGQSPPCLRVRLRPHRPRRCVHRYKL